MPAEMLDPRAFSRIDELLADYPEGTPLPEGHRYATPDENLALVRQMLELGEKENDTPIYVLGLLELTRAGMTPEAVSALFPCIVREPHTGELDGVFRQAEVFRRIEQSIDERADGPELVRAKREVLDRIVRYVTYHVMMREARQDVMRDLSAERRRIKGVRRQKARDARAARKKSRR